MTRMQPSWPRRPLESSSLYVVEFDQGTIKVGHSANIKGRFTALGYQAAQFGIHIEQQWASEITSSGPRLEKHLIDWCSQHATGGYGFEWFTGLDFVDVKGFAVDLLPASEAAA